MSGASGNDDEEKSLRDGVNHANAVVWGPVRHRAHANETRRNYSFERLDSDATTRHRAVKRNVRLPNEASS